MNSPVKLITIDAALRRDHHHLTEDDECFAVGEYTRRGGYAASATNNLISNLKKDVRLRGQPQWRYKEQAIRDAGKQIRSAISTEALPTITFVPMPPSKAKDDPAYDDRMVRICDAIVEGAAGDVRELVVQTGSREARHIVGGPRDVGSLQLIYSIDETLTEPPPVQIMVVDDVLNTGASFKAIKAVLQDRFPGVPVYGMFVARCLPDTNFSIDIDALFGNAD